MFNDTGECLEHRRRGRPLGSNFDHFGTGPLSEREIQEAG